MKIKFLDTSDGKKRYVSFGYKKFSSNIYSLELKPTSAIQLCRFSSYKNVSN